MVLGFTFMSVTHLHLTFAYGLRDQVLFFFHTNKDDNDLMLSLQA